MKNPEEEDIRSGLMKMKTAGFSCVDESMSDTVKTMVETKASEVSAYWSDAELCRGTGHRRKTKTKRRGPEEKDGSEG